MEVTPRRQTRGTSFIRRLPRALPSLFHYLFSHLFVDKVGEDKEDFGPSALTPVGHSRRQGQVADEWNNHLSIVTGHFFIFLHPSKIPAFQLSAFPSAANQHDGISKDPGALSGEYPRIAPILSMFWLACRQEPWKTDNPFSRYSWH